MIKVKVTLTDDEDHRRRSKVTKIELMVIYRKRLHPGPQISHLVPWKYENFNVISFLGFDVSSSSCIKVKCHRRGGVCALWMLLVLFWYELNANSTTEANIVHSLSFLYSWECSFQFFNHAHSDYYCALVNCHWGVCVLWMLLVLFLYGSNANSRIYNSG